MDPIIIDTSIDYSHFINPHSSRRRPALTRELTKLHYLAPKGAISLAEGMPNEGTFPFESLNIVMKDGSSFAIKGQQLGSALQYIPSQGYPPLIELLKTFIEESHRPPNCGVQRELMMTTGSQDGISKAIEMCLQEGEPVVVQNPLYSGTEGILKPFKPTLIPINQDHQGMIPTSLRTALEEWKIKCEGGGTAKMPKLMYVNPTGSNPTGTTMSLERRVEIYAICCEYNILILEDDAYCYMNFGEKTPPSFLSLDTEGRVLRFDSMSKVLSSGLRLGWVTGPKPLVHAMELHIQSSYLHSSSLSQVLFYSLLKNWGTNKLLSHFESVKEVYRARRDITLAAMDKHLKGLCDWSVPQGGMFVWINVRGVADVYEMLMTRGTKKGITFVPGHAFMADPAEACSFIRASYSRATPKQIDKAMSLLAELIREEKVLLRRKLENCT